MTYPLPSDEPAALFVPDGPWLVPTARSRGPWSDTALHGGPVAALVTRSTEALFVDDGLQMVRLTLELMRPVPLTPLLVTSRVIRPGRRVQLVDTVVEADGVEVALARALRIRVATDRPAPVSIIPEDPAPDPPVRRPSQPLAFGELTAFHNAGSELRHVGSSPGQLGPATVWVRLLVPVVPDEPLTPWQRAAAAADFGNGVSSEVSFDSGLFINPDLTVSLYRLPVGEWICVDARTRYGSPGIGSAASSLWDVEGRIGHSVQNLVIDMRA